MVGEDPPLDIVNFASWKPNVLNVSPILSQEHLHVYHNIIVYWINKKSTELPAVKSENNIGLAFPVINVFLGILHVVRVDFFLHFVNFYQVLVWVHQLLGPDDECRLHMMVVMLPMNIMMLFWVLSLCVIFLACGF